MFSFLQHVVLLVKRLLTLKKFLEKQGGEFKKAKIVLSRVDLETGH